MKVTSLLLVCLFISSCATTMPGNEVSTGDKKVTASLATLSDYTNDQIQFYQFSLKNETDTWIELEGATLEASNSISVLVGARLSSWIEACTLEKNVSDYNTALVLGSVAVAGAAVAGASQHKGTSTAGAVFALGSIGALGVRDYQNSKDRVEFQKAFPERHIFQQVVIPPRKVIQRWIVVENPQNEAFKLSLKNKAEQINLFVPSRTIIK